MCTAAVALLNYLSKLEEVAKLEPCGIHYVENTPGTADDIAHVVARTAGANRKYFYRRREGGSWTPWEQIKLDIEDNPVIPVVWKDRLFLFWLKILQQAPFNTQKMPSVPLAGVIASDIITTGEIKVTVKAVLCWSEYYNGKWQPTKTSDVNRPTELGQFDSTGPNSFDRSAAGLAVHEVGTVLQVDIYGASYLSSFLLYNTHSLPLRNEDRPADWEGPEENVRIRVLYDANGTFMGLYEDIIRGSVHDLTRAILKVKRKMRYRVVEPRHHLHNTWDAPFFFEDSHHVFYVSTTERDVPIDEWTQYGITNVPGDKTQQVPPLVFKEDISLLALRDRPLPLFISGAPGVVDPAPVERFVSEDAYITKGIGTTGTVRYGKTEIGPAGKILHGIATR